MHTLVVYLKFLKAGILISSASWVVSFCVCKYLKHKFAHRDVPIPPVLTDGLYKNSKLTSKRKSEGSKDFVYDVVIVGGGPGGSSCAYFCTKNKSINSICILEKSKYPRDKYCGNAVCYPALQLIKQIGVLQELVEKDEIQISEVGGVVSPSGLSYIGQSTIDVGEPLAGAVKRTILDERLVRHAERSGCDVFENCFVESAEFDSKDGVWTVYASEDMKFVCRMLVCSDGAQSALARKLGLVTEAPKGVCTRAYIKGGTHCANVDGLCFYPPYSMPGYCAIFRHVGDELNFCYYLIPCGADDKLGDCNDSDLPSLHKFALEKDPFVSKMIGPNAEIEKMRMAPLRVACQGVKMTYSDHLLIIGDAAGFIDPITGEGIHNALLSGRDAALTLGDLFENGDFSSESTKQYEARWMNSFGYDFRLSSLVVNILWRHPIILDAVLYYMQCDRGKAFATWATVMTQYRGKEVLLEPRVFWGILKGLLFVSINKYILRSPAYDWGQRWQPSS